MKKFLLLTIAIFYVNVCHGQTSLFISDTRYTPTTPDSYSQSLMPHFKAGGALGLPNPYYTIIGLRGWSDNSGGKSHELAFSDENQILFRSGHAPQWEGWRKLLTSSENGNYGIGTASPTELLSVNGKIRSKELKVEVANWPDYVFEEDYELMSLLETEKFIKANKRLPEIPSAVQVEKEGLDIGEMNKLLLKKIEELTLHLLDLQKQHLLFQKRIENLETKK